MSGSLRRVADRDMDALITAASTDVAEHGVVDLLVGRGRRLRQQRRRLHDLAGLAVAALRDADVAPGHLHGMLALGVEPLDGDDRFVGDVRHRDAAGADRLAVDMNRAGAAQRDAAAELRSGQAELVAQVPQERHRRVTVEAARLSIHTYADHAFLLGGVLESRSAAVSSVTSPEASVAERWTPPYAMPSAGVLHRLRTGAAGHKKSAVPPVVAMLIRRRSLARFIACRFSPYLCPRGGVWAGDLPGKSIALALSSGQTHGMRTGKAPHAMRSHEKFTGWPTSATSRPQPPIRLAAPAPPRSAGGAGGRSRDRPRAWCRASETATAAARRRSRTRAAGGSRRRSLDRARAVSRPAAPRRSSS